ncbi:unnamed protein product [Darwinula stevensoni]|uniref:Bestrophin homolog n=1 Tax=Darwinula stevensoni TaxID=69355 RepID=A0A7R9AH72_9CRUS|nr:unnamed protein product [Darwinula stevensoni]CAG0904999.1 unnamed protein product [Darwinula stevensoni]
MTVTYTAEVTTVRPFGNFWRMLFRWRGSIYKLVWQDLLVFLAAFYAVNFTYRLGLSRERRLVFEYVSRIFNDFLSLVPMAFVLGFYVSLVMKRFWDQWWKIPRPDATMVNLVGYFQKDNERSRLMRRTLARYLNLSYVMAMSGVSPRVKRRFPTLQHLVEVGMLEAGELPILTGLGEKYKGNLFWVPIVWCMTIAKKALDEELADSERGYTQTVRCLDEFREGARKVLEYDRISIPLVYTQFFFYVGWLKVAETLINPFGDDDDDFELNGLADRHLQVSTTPRPRCSGSSGQERKRCGRHLHHLVCCYGGVNFVAVVPDLSETSVFFFHSDVIPLVARVVTPETIEECWTFAIFSYLICRLLRDDAWVEWIRNPRVVGKRRQKNKWIPGMASRRVEKKKNPRYALQRHKFYSMGRVPS